MQGKEHRRDTRVKVNWQAKAARKGQGVFNVQIRNVSVRGLYFESPHSFSEKSRIFLEVKAKHEDRDQNLLIEGEIVRVAPGSAEDLQGHGVQILRIRDNDLFFLLSIVAELWEEQQKLPTS